jgi:hypothetical protein
MKTTFRVWCLYSYLAHGSIATRTEKGWEGGKVSGCGDRDLFYFWTSCFLVKISFTFPLDTAKLISEKPERSEL